MRLNQSLTCDASWQLGPRSGRPHRPVDRHRLLPDGAAYGALALCEPDAVQRPDLLRVAGLGSHRVGSLQASGEIAEQRIDRKNVRVMR